MTLSQSTVDVSSFFLETTLAALADCGREPVSTAYIASGQVAWDDCCGTLIVAPERVYRSQTFPAEFVDLELCDGGYLVIELVVLLLRCVPVVDDRGRAPSAAALGAAYQSLLDDAAVVYNAVTCPIPDYWMRATPTQTFVGAEGGCIGVETRVRIGLEQEEWAICCAEPAPHEPGDPICRIPAARVSFDPCEPLTSTNVQDAICELLGLVEDIGQPGGRPHGAFHDEQQQSLAVGTPGAMLVRQTDLSSGVTIVGGSQITFAAAGVYDVQFSAQVHNLSGGGSGHYITIWLAQGGTPVPNSATRMHIRNGETHVAAWDWMVDVLAGENIQIMWQTTSANIVLDVFPAVGSIPAVPSVIVTVLSA